MAARMVRVKDNPGIYKRGSRYVVVVYVNGRQRKRSAKTLTQARDLRFQWLAQIGRGEYQEQSREKFRAYAEQWIERYRGNGRRGFTDDTRDDYRRDLHRYAFPFFDDRLGKRLTQITPRDVNDFVAWLCDENEQGRRHAIENGLPLNVVEPRRLSDASVRRILAPVRSCLATARAEDLIRHNPADGAVMPRRDEAIVETDPDDPRDDEGKVKVLSREQLRVFMDLVNPRFRLMFWFLAVTGLRWSELIEVRWADLQLDGSEPAVAVSRARVRGKVKRPKSRHGRRNVPLDAALVFELRSWRKQTEWGGENDVVFPSTAGTPLDSSTVRRRVLKPAAAEAGAGWAGFHTFRHTCASLLFARGATAVQVQRWLGHHSPAFTLERYVHVLPGEGAAALRLVDVLGVATSVATEGPGNGSSAATPDIGAVPDFVPDFGNAGHPEGTPS